LGLPSGVLWATRNIGANSAIAYGDFYSWGNVDGHAPDSGYDFSAVVYAQTPGAQLTADIDAAHDAAAVAWGDGWRMPSLSELDELRDNCTFSEVTVAGVTVIRAVSNNNGHSVLFPCAGYGINTVISGVGVYAECWGTRLDSQGRASRIRLHGSSASVSAVASRYCGFSIRAVRDP